MITLAVLLGSGVGLGLIMALAGLRPAPPKLEALQARIEGHDPAWTNLATGGGRRLLDSLTRLLADHLLVPRTDLELLSTSAERLAARKLTATIAGLLTPPLFGAALAALGVVVTPSIPAGGALIAASVAFFVPDLNARSTAARRREDFRHAMTAYFDLVRLAFAAGAGPNEALEQAPHHSASWPFRRIAAAVDQAQAARVPPWHGLARLGTRVGVPELADLADFADLAETEGTPIVPIITAYTESMRTRRLTAQRAKANAGTATMAIPIATIGLAFVVLLAFPQIYTLLTG